jgi:thymidylate synthase (FAD)
METLEMYVLDHGIIRLIDYMGTEKTIADCARMSTSNNGDIALRDPDGFPEKMDERDVKLIRILQESGHGTPFEHVVFRWYFRAPLFVMRQWMRHRIGTFSEFSMRYRPHCDVTDALGAYYTPKDMPESAKDAYRSAMDAMNNSFRFLESRIGDDVPSRRRRELLRCVLPVSIYSEAIWTVNMRSLMNFLRLRSTEHAQVEIRVYADAIRRILAPIFPHVDLVAKV